MIKLVCECGNNEAGGFDIYVSRGELCDILTVVCKRCREVSEEYIACGGDSLILKC